MRSVIALAGCGIALIVAGCDAQRVHDLASGSPTPALVQASDTVQVRSVDGAEQDGVFIGQDHRYSVAPGKHVFVVEYGEMFFTTADSHDKVKSVPLRLTFDARAGGAYKFRHAPQTTLDAARVFAKRPEIELVDIRSGQPVNAVVEKGEASGFFTTMHLPIVAQDNDFKPVVAAPPAASVSAPVAVSAHSRAIQDAADDGNLDILQTAWKHASAAQRKAFLEWVNTTH